MVGFEPAKFVSYSIIIVMHERATAGIKKTNCTWTAEVYTTVYLSLFLSSIKLSLPYIVRLKIYFSYPPSPSESIYSCELKTYVLEHNSIYACLHLSKCMARQLSL